eukprot:3443781-Prymnesium_polylepis.1
MSAGRSRPRCSSSRAAAAVAPKRERVRLCLKRWATLAGLQLERLCVQAYTFCALLLRGQTGCIAPRASRAGLGGASPR